MGDASHHARLAREKRLGAMDELSKGRYTNVGDLAFKAVEQAIEAATSIQNLHFHAHPRSAHPKRNEWVKANFPQISADLDMLRSVYGDLGYDGLNGKRAREAIKAMERMLDEIGRKTGISFK